MWDSAHRQDPEDVEAAVLFVPQQHRSVEPDRLQVGVEFRFLPFGVTGMTYTVDLTGCSAAETPGDPALKVAGPLSDAPNAAHVFHEDQKVLIESGESASCRLVLKRQPRSLALEVGTETLHRKFNRLVSALGLHLSLQIVEQRRVVIPNLQVRTGENPGALDAELLGNDLEKLKERAWHSC
jgi:hypothetical protein